MSKALLCIILLSLGPAYGGQEKQLEKQAEKPSDGQPAFPAGHFHHLHLNSTNPASALDFYTSKFDCERGRFDGSVDAVWAQKSWLLFTKVGEPPPWELTSAIWHFGWGAEDMRAAYQKQLDSGTRFFTPLTDISDLARVPNFFFAYVDGPDRALIELNTAGHHRFGHLHLFSEDPVSAGQWYMKYIGATRRGALPSREPRFYRNLQVGPSMSFNLDNVNVIIFPIEHSKQAYPTHWKKGQTRISPTRGRVVDHVAFSFDNLAEALERMRRDGVKVTQGIKTMAGGKTRHAFVEGPDNIRIELIEGHARNQ
ncbi:MAG TPA: VOC family protein [Blastocatellia bacterium]|nr:VOC family protein [Blastocatellia bacterium]